MRRRRPILYPVLFIFFIYPCSCTINKHSSTGDLTGLLGCSRSRFKLYNKVIYIYLVYMKNSGLEFTTNLRYTTPVYFDWSQQCQYCNWFIYRLLQVLIPHRIGSRVTVYVRRNRPARYASQRFGEEISLKRGQKQTHTPLSPVLPRERAAIFTKKKTSTIRDTGSATNRRLAATAALCSWLRRVHM